MLINNQPGERVTLPTPRFFPGHISYIFDSNKPFPKGNVLETLKRSYLKVALREQLTCTHAPYTLHAYLNTHTRAGARSPRFIHAFIYRKPSRENSARFARERRWAALPGTRVAPQPRSPSRHLYWQSPSSPPSRSRAAFRYMSILCTPLRIVFSVIRQSGVCGASWPRAGRQAQAATSSSSSGGSSDSRAGAMPGPLSRRLLLRRPPGPARCHRRRHQGRHGPRGPARVPARGEGPQGSAAERSVTPLRCALSPVPCAVSSVPCVLSPQPCAVSPQPCPLCRVPCAVRGPPNRGSDKRACRGTWQLGAAPGDTELRDSVGWEGN